MNPFTLSFGKKPDQYISRLAQTNMIIDDLNASEPSAQLYMLTGVRGSGKTVMLSTISHELRQKADWIVVELNPTRDLLTSLAAKLYAIDELHTLFIKARFDFSAFGLGVAFENTPPVTDIETVLELMLKKLREHNKRLLVTIDEVTANDHIKVFASSFQIFIRQDLPLFLLMTGLFENISEIQDDRALTFLYRAPKINLAPLNLNAITASYQNILHVPSKVARKMALTTRGYPFAYQVLGYLWYQQKPQTIEQLLPEFDQYLQELVYQKIWQELSSKDQDVLATIAKSGRSRIKDIREALGFSSSLMSVYRERLKQKGLVDTRDYGYLSLTLPRFENFIELYHELR